MDSKILPYLEKIVSNLIRDTEYKIHTVNYGGTIGDLLVDIYFPMYPDEGYTYTEYELLDWIKDPTWLVGTSDIKYFENYYGLSEYETEIVLNMFLLKFSSIIYDEMGKHKTF
jgi:hypothetical protein